MPRVPRGVSCAEKTACVLHPFLRRDADGEFLAARGDLLSTARPFGGAVSLRWSIRNQILIPLLAIQAVAVAAITLATATLAARRSERQIIDRLNGVIDALGHANFPYTASVLAQDAAASPGPSSSPMRRTAGSRRSSFSSLDGLAPVLSVRPADGPPRLARRFADGRRSDGIRYFAVPLRSSGGPRGSSLAGPLPRDELAAGEARGGDAPLVARRRLARPRWRRSRAGSPTASVAGSAASSGRWPASPRATSRSSTPAASGTRSPTSPRSINRDVPPAEGDEPDHPAVGADPAPGPARGGPGPPAAELAHRGADERPAAREALPGPRRATGAWTSPSGSSR